MVFFYFVLPSNMYVTPLGNFAVRHSTSELTIKCGWDVGQRMSLLECVSRHGALR